MKKVQKFIVSANPTEEQIKKFRAKSSAPRQENSSLRADQNDRRDENSMFAIEVSSDLMKNLCRLSSNEINTNLENKKWVLKYKAVDKKKRPVPNIFPESVKVIRRFPSNPLERLPKLPFQAPEFIATKRLTEKRMKNLELEENKDLRGEERKLLEHILQLNERSIAFAEEERGTFRRDYFSDYQMPVMEHEPWKDRNIPLPPGHRDEILRLLKEKIDVGVYEPAQSSYRSRWFCVAKKNGELRIVHDLQTLNSVSVMDSGVPPILDEFVESFAGRAIYSVLDMYWGFYARVVHPKSRDMTAFQTPLGELRITSLPMGYTNSPAEFQACMMYILQDEVPEKAGVFIDDIPIKGPITQYLDKNGEPEVLPENSGIRRFVWEHLQDVHRILWRIGEAGGTVSGKKMQLCQKEATIVGHRCTSEGRYPTEGRAEKIHKWPQPVNLKDVRGFLGLCGTVRIWIKDYSQIARPLVELTKKGVDFHWEKEQEKAFEQLKDLVSSAPAMRPVDYRCGRKVYLSVDTSIHGIGFVLSQEDEKGRHVPARYGSLPITERESRYSQAKLELFGLFRALKHYSMFLAGVKNLVVEVDAKYIKGMLKNPDCLPGTAVSRWIQGILLFTFEMVHIPANRHKAPDALSRRGYREDEPEPDPDPDSWLDDIALLVFAEKDPPPNGIFIGMANTSESQDKDLERILRYLITHKTPQFSDTKALKSFLTKSKRFFTTENGMYQIKTDSSPQKVIFGDDNRQRLMEEFHEKAGHRGEWAVLDALKLRFYWPKMRQDVRYHVASCHTCQSRSTKKMHLPIQANVLPNLLFQKVYLDVMKMPEAQGKKWIVVCREDVAGVCEAQALAKDNARSIAIFFREQILYRYGAIPEVVTDNGPSLAGEFAKLAKEFNVKQIKISPYNSSANGIVERAHFNIREILVKACDGDMSQWPKYLQAAVFADRITTRRATGYSPFYLLHGVHPMLPCDLSEATFLSSQFTKEMATEDLLAARIKQLAKMPQDLARARKILKQSRFQSSQAFEKKFGRRLIMQAHVPGSLVLMRNVPLENTMAISRKTTCRYMGPYQVIGQTKGNSYWLCELDGTRMKIPVAAFRLIPYVKREDLEKWKRKMDIQEAIAAQNKNGHV